MDMIHAQTHICFHICCSHSFKSNDTLLINFLLFDVTIIFLGTSQILDAFLCCAILYSTGHGLYLTHWYAPLSTQYSFDHIVGTK